MSLLVCACSWGTAPTPGASAEPEDPPAPRAEPAAAPTEPPSILSAHFSRVDDPELGGLDAVIVVFDQEIDAASLDPRAFVVSREGRGPVLPTRALLSPASEDDENRSLLLVGDFGDADPTRAPSHVAIIGPVFTESGARLSGLGASVSPFTVPPRVVAASLLVPGPGRCEGAASLLRTYWSEELRGVEPDDLGRIRVESGGTAEVHPLGFDDHATLHAEAGQDNVLDLCLPEAVTAVQVRVDAGIFRDVAGHGSEAVELRVDDAGS